MNLKLIKTRSIILKICIIKLREKDFLDEEEIQKNKIKYYSQKIFRFIELG